MTSTQLLIGAICGRIMYIQYESDMMSKNRVQHNSVPSFLSLLKVQIQPTSFTPFMNYAYFKNIIYENEFIKNGNMIIKESFIIHAID